MLLDNFYEYDVKFVRVIDGDTVVLRFDLGFKISVEQTVRLFGIDTPEIIGEDHESALLARAATEKHIAGAHRLRARTDKPAKHDKYGRYLAEIVLISSDGNETSLNRLLLDEGHAVSYDGRRRQVTTAV